MIERIPKERWGNLNWVDFGGQPPIEGELWGYIEDGEVLGHYLVERDRVHVGAFHVKHEHRGNGIASALAQHAHDTLGSGYYVSAMTPQTVAMCEKHGMTEISGVLFVQESSVLPDLEAESRLQLEANAPTANGLARE